MKKTERFILAMTPVEKATLEQLAEYADLSAAAVVRHLVRREARELGLVTEVDPLRGRHLRAVSVGGAA